MENSQFLLKWNNHQPTVVSVLDVLFNQEAFVDVTLACDGQRFPAHKVVLSACSEYFQELLLQNPCEHPIIFLKDVRARDLFSLLQFMYRGEINVHHDDLPQFLRTAESLQIKGLADNSSQRQLDEPMTDVKPIAEDSDDLLSRPSRAPFAADTGDASPVTDSLRMSSLQFRQQQHKLQQRMLRFGNGLDPSSSSTISTVGGLGRRSLLASALGRLVRSPVIPGLTEILPVDSHRDHAISELEKDSTAASSLAPNSDVTSVALSQSFALSVSPPASSGSTNAPPSTTTASISSVGISSADQSASATSTVTTALSPLPVLSTCELREGVSSPPALAKLTTSSSTSSSSSPALSSLTTGPAINTANDDQSLDLIASKQGATVTTSALLGHQSLAVAAVAAAVAASATAAATPVFTPSTPLMCKYCGQMFSDASNRFRHEKRHKHPEEVHVCFVCKRPFSRKDNMKKHVKTVHGVSADQEHLTMSVNSSAAGSYSNGWLPPVTVASAVSVGSLQAVDMTTSR